MTTVRFIQAFYGYKPGEVARLETRLAGVLLRKGIVMFVSEGYEVH